jgi:choline dehydrogenase-like flavoprotein
MGSLSSIIVALALLNVRVVAATTINNNTYEYIVVGSGPGGGPLASNLARAGHSVLLLEAGDDQTENLNVSNWLNFNLAGNDPATVRAKYDRTKTRLINCLALGFLCEALRRRSQGSEVFAQNLA